MANDDATVWGGQIRLGREPADKELLLGNSSGSFTLTPSSSIVPSPDIQTLLDGISTTQGAILFRNADDWVALNPGTSGQVLSTKGAAANPSWVSLPATPWTEVVKTSANDSSISSTTFTSVTGLSFSVVANIFYSFEFGLIMNTTTSRGLKIAFSVPGGSLLANSGNIYNSAGSVTFIGITYSGGGTSSTTAAFVIPTIADTGVYVANILGTFSCTSSGTIQLLFNQISTGAAAVTVNKGSWLRYRTV